MSESNGTPSVFDNSVLLCFTVHVPGNSAKGDVEAIDAGAADKTLLKLSKQLLDCPEYKALQDVAKEFRERVKACGFGGRTVTFTGPDGKKRSVGRGLMRLFKKGVYVLPLDNVERADCVITECTPRFEEATKTFCSVYEQRRDEAMERLGPQADADDYPPVEKVRRGCSVEYDYITVGLPEKLQKVKADLFSREKAKAKAKWAEAGEEVRLVLRATLKELTDHLLDILKPGDNGKKRKLHESAVTKLSDFLENVKGLNLTGDVELDRLTEAAKVAMSGRTVEDLRKDEGARLDVQERLGAVKAELDTLVMEAPERMISLED